MRELTISTGASRKTTNWTIYKWPWESIKCRCSQPAISNISMAAFSKLSKEEAAEYKDHGGMVFGQLKDGVRSKKTVLTRSGITLDLDHADADLWDKKLTTLPYILLVYSTFRHTSQHPRLRIVIPLSEDVPVEQYEPIARKIAEDIGIEMVDPVSFNPAQLMYWPAHPVDGEFYFKEKGGEYLDPASVLARYDDWEDSSSWPHCKKDKPHSTAKQQADPLEKEGVVGAFCRTYSIQDVIEKFLPEIYEPTDSPDRFHYAPSSSSAGVLVYDDKFCYSNHAKDPVCGKLLNAFDLVRIHFFGEKDEEIPAGTQSANLPSFKAMIDFALEDPDTKMTLLKEKSSARDDFNSDDWLNELVLDKGGNVKPTFENMRLILLNDENLKPIVYNEFTDMFDVIGELPWSRPKESWRDSDFENLKGYLERVYGLWSPSKIKGAFLAVITSEKAYHPVREYLDSLSWDGKSRIDRVLIDFLGAPDTPYVRAVTRKTLVAAVSRIYEPGRKFDSVLVICGDQGVGKSTLLAKLGREWFSDSLSISDMKDKTSAEKLKGYWIIEISELAGMKKMDVETVKSFISRTDDVYRPAYGAFVESHPRSSIICGTTNASDGFLRDITGNRRFWPVKVSGQGKFRPWELADPSQIWAEAIHYYHLGEELFLTNDLAAEASKEQQSALESDDREGMVYDFLERLLPADWETMDLYARRNFLAGSEFGHSGKDGTIKRLTVSPMEVWCECFGKNQSDISRSDSIQIIAILNKLGWYALKNEKGTDRRKRIPIYGLQRIFARSRYPVKEEISVSELLA